MMKKAAGPTMQRLRDDGGSARQEFKAKIIRARAPGWRSGNEFRSKSYGVLTSDASGASPSPAASPSLCATRRWRA
jgi:hypothetical protein